MSNHIPAGTNRSTTRKPDNYTVVDALGYGSGRVGCVERSRWLGVQEGRAHIAATALALTTLLVRLDSCIINATR